jgi:thiopeptide-type bacteriocin biosynthesis protein
VIHDAVWWQYNVALVRGDAGARCEPAFDCLSSVCDQFAAEPSSLERWFFMRKPPDVRLRVLAVAAFHRALEKRLYSLAEQGAIVSVVRTIYEPQVGLFGGSYGMSLAHEQFHVDSQTWRELRALEAAGTTVDWGRLVSALHNDFFAAALEGSDEVWEVWRLLQRRRPGGTPRPLTYGDLDLTAMLATCARPVSERVLALAARNRDIACRMQELALRGELLCGPRAWLANAAHFQLNRWGIARASECIESMVQYLDPNGPYLEAVSP